MKKLFVCGCLMVSLVVGATAQLWAAGDAALIQVAEVASLNINTATSQDLRGLPGIGKVTAERIVAYRAEHGSFQSPDDLVKVRGVGKKTLEKVRGLIHVE